MFHEEMTIPVNKDKRNFEDRRKDMLSNLESNVSSQSSTASSTATKKQTSSKNTSLVRADDAWDSEVNDWILKSRSGWNDELSRIKNSFFSLEPNEDWDLGNTVSSTSVTKKVTTTKTMDGNTSSSTAQSYHTSSTGGSSKPATGGQNALTEEMRTGAAICDNSSTNSSANNMLASTDFFKDAYELSDDKSVHFKVRLDSSGFKPEDISITATSGKVTIKAKKETQTGSSHSSREFSRTITVPPSVDISKFQCQQTQDGVLILEAPLKQQEHMSISAKEGLGVRAISDQKSTFSNALVTVTGKSGPVVMDDDVYGKKIHLEIPVDNDYEPTDFSVYTDLNKIHIKGRHETKTANSSSFKEFSRYYEVPETLDPMSISFHLLGGTLVVEAPLLRSV